MAALTAHQRAVMCSIGPSQPRKPAPGPQARCTGPLFVRQPLGVHKSSGRVTWNRWQQASQATSGGGGGGTGGSSGGGGGGSGGGDDGQEPPRPEAKAWGWKGWQDRVAADPQFVYKIVIEQVIGVTANVLGDMATRPNWGLNELDFVFATLVVGMCINFGAVYLLAPVAPAGGAAATSAGFFTKLFGDTHLVRWGAPTGHCFQPGFPFPARLTNFFYKGLVFGVIGLGAGVVGTATSNGLLALRKRMDPAYSSPNEAPSVLANAGAWGLHMAVSANTRYQMVNGLDMALQPLIPTPVFRVFTSLLRGLNNLAGGVSFGLLVKALGVQKAAQAAAPAAAPPALAAGKKRK